MTITTSQVNKSLFCIALILILFPTVGFSLCVNASKAQLRAGPSTKHKVTWIVGRYMPLLDEDKQGNWYKVRDQDNDVHWIHASLVTNKESCMSVKVPVARLRQGPSLQSELAELPQADRYTALKYLDRNEAWFNVEDAFGQKFWVHESNVWRPMKINKFSF